MVKGVSSWAFFILDSSRFPAPAVELSSRSIGSIAAAEAEDEEEEEEEVENNT